MAEIGGSELTTEATETTGAKKCSDGQVQVAGGKVHYLYDGEGAPIVILHRSIGNHRWLHFYEDLAGDHRVIVPDLPGYAESERPQWAVETRDLGLLVHRLLDRLELGSVTCIGLGYGGWLAAEMAVQNQHRFERLVLVGAGGILPDEGEILDQMMLDYEAYVRAGFADESAFEREFGEKVEPEVLELWNYSREMTARIAWKPYMWDGRLPHLLAEVVTPTLLVWGSADGIVPPGVGRQYANALPNARLEIVEGGGHLLEIERPAELAALIRGFTGS